MQKLPQIQLLKADDLIKDQRSYCTILIRTFTELFSDKECEQHLQKFRQIIIYLRSAIKICSQFISFCLSYSRTLQAIGRLAAKLSYKKWFQEECEKNLQLQWTGEDGFSQINNIVSARLKNECKKIRGRSQKKEINSFIQNYLNLQMQTQSDSIKPQIDPACLGCINTVQKPFSFQNYTIPYFLNFDNAFSNMSLTKTNMLKQICALLNEGGGYIFFGMEPQCCSPLKLSGICFTPEKADWLQKFFFPSFLSEAHSMIMPSHVKNQQNILFPSFKLSSSLVKVVNNDKNNGQEWSQFIWRIGVSRIAQTKSLRMKMKFYHVNTKGFPSKYELYVRKNNDILKLEEEQIYKAIHRCYQCLQKAGKVSWNGINICNSALCPTEIPKLSHLINNLFRKPTKKIKKSERQKEQQSQNIEITYQNNSVLIIPSIKYNYIAQNLKQQFLRKKMRVQFKLPYLAYREKSGRQIWYLSHYESFQVIYKQIKSKKIYEKITLISMSTALLVHKSSENQQNFPTPFWQEFRKILDNKFTEQIQLKPAQKSSQKFTFIQFSCLKVSLFSFLYLQSKGIRSQFNQNPSNGRSPFAQIYP